VLEVFVNERTAISTRIYAAEETVGIRFFADDDAMTASVESASAVGSQLLEATLWDGLAV
jgi:beta-fructofuranosidase